MAITIDVQWEITRKIAEWLLESFMNENIETDEWFFNSILDEKKIKMKDSVKQLRIEKMWKKLKDINRQEKTLKSSEQTSSLEKVFSESKLFLSKQNSAK